jgi:large subunit ribosomal protein L35
MPKNKSHSGMKKRVKVSGSGKILKQHAGMRHNQEHKSSRLTRSLSGTTEVNAADRSRVKKLLGI